MLRRDCATLQAFAVFCGMGISNTRMYEQVVKAMARQSIALDILAYHTSASVEEVQRLKVPSHHRSRIRYLSKKSRILTNFPKLKKFVKFVQKFVKFPSERGLPVE